MRTPLILFFAVLVFLSATLSSGSVGRQLTPAPPPLTSLPASVLDAELKSARGRSFKISEYSGKVLVINLWAAWVIPSRLETPTLVKLQAQFWSQGVRVIGLSTENPDESTKEVRDWVRHYRIQYRIGWATPAVATTLFQGREILPQTYVVSRTGRVVRRFVGFNYEVSQGLVKEAIQEALAEKPNLPLPE